MARELGRGPAAGKRARIHGLFKAAAPWHAAMAMLIALMLLALGAPAMGEPAQHRDQDEAWAGRRDGRLLPLKEIERRVVPTMHGAQYIGVDFDAASAVYTLKFLRGGAVIWVDVDGRSGQIIGRTGR